MIYFITGKPGAGKTTYAEKLAKEIAIRRGKVRLIDGDWWRELHDNQDFSEEGRKSNLDSAARDAGKAEAMGMVVVMSFVAPKKEYREMMYRYWKEWITIYIPGGKLWPGTEYEVPGVEELRGG